ncbi:WD40 repeat domain-containing protein [Sphingobacterium sp. DR205]|uniref:WD40 repeat domain-containing protein n=1 Tax=Sphingobacterium sp. DR205 TaxID=2713573 RepID=UPI0013E488D8|nr:WD40 repeat domain-containing protein [Sphingobacterium sp. DR205]QIH33416.1 WD40 repeat domain-containing protein [Sphingobacterium sp. DR205]
MITHKSPISGIATFNQKFIATAGYDNIVILWDADNGRSLGRGCHDHLVNQCLFSPDGKYLATSSSDYTTRIWSVPDMSLVSVLKGHKDDVEGLSFHHTRDIIATSSRDKTICIFQIDGKLIKTLNGHKEDVISVEWMYNSDIIISSSDDGTVKFWDANTGEIVKDLSFNDVETDTIALTSEATIFAGNDDGEIIIIEDNVEPVVIQCHNAGIKRLVYSEQEKRLISLSYDRTFKVWDYIDKGLKLKSTQQFNNVVWPRSAAFLNTTEIVFASFGDRYAHFDLSKEVWLDNGIESTLGVNAVCELNGSTYTVGDSGYVKQNGEVRKELGSLCNFIVPFGNLLITGGQTGSIFNALTGETYYQHKSPLNCAAEFEVNGVKKIVVGSYTGEVIILQSVNDEVFLDQVIRFHQNAIKGVSVSENYIFTVCATGAAAFHDIENYKEIKYIKNGHDKIANGCTSLGKNTFASVSRDLKLRVWNVDDVSVYETPHTNSIKCIGADNTGRYLLLGSYVGFVSLFDNGERRFTKHIRLSDFGISNIGFHSDSGKFLASSYNGKVYQVDIEPLINCKDNLFEL